MRSQTQFGFWELADPRNVSMTLRYLRDKKSIVWQPDQASDRHVVWLVDPNLGRGPGAGFGMPRMNGSGCRA